MAASMGHAPGFEPNHVSRLHLVPRTSRHTLVPCAAFITSPGTTPTRAIVPVLAHHAAGALRRMRRSGKRLALRKCAAQTFGSCYAAVASSQAPHYPVGFCSPSARGPQPIQLRLFRQRFHAHSAGLRIRSHSHSRRSSSGHNKPGARGLTPGSTGLATLAG